MEIISYKNLRWVNIKGVPAAKDIDWIKQNTNFHPLVIEELLSPTLHPKLDFYEDHLYLVLHFPEFKKEEGEVAAAELDIIASRELLVTIQYADMPAINKLFDTLSKDENLKAKYLGGNAGLLLHKILETKFEFVIKQMDYVVRKVDEVEDKIFKAKRRKLVESISLLQKEVVDIRRTQKPAAIILKALTSRAKELFGKDSSPYFTDLETLHAKVSDIIENQRDTLQTLFATNEALIAHRLNDIMKTLTIFSVILLPLNLIASLWGMNVLGLPFGEHISGFWFVLGIMLFSAAVMLGFFIRKKWL